MRKQLFVGFSNRVAWKLQSRVVLLILFGKYNIVYHGVQ